MRNKGINSGNRVRKKNGFDVVYEEYHKMVFRIAYHYTCNREEAEDISQVVLADITFFQKPVCDKRTGAGWRRQPERCGESRKTYKL